MDDTDDAYERAQTKARASIALTQRPPRRRPQKAAPSLSPHDSGDLDTHPLAHATCPTPSVSGTVVYVVCACGQRRVVAAGVWAQEMARRARAV